MSPADTAPTLDALLAARAAAAPEHPLYTFLDAQGAEVGTLTTGGLSRRARSVATTLVDRGATGRPVLVCVGPGAEHPVALFGTFAAGATVIPVYPPPPDDAGVAVDAIANVARASGAGLLLAPEGVGGPLAAGLRARLGGAAPALVTLEDASGVEPAADLPGSAPDAAAIVLFTSGSTGAPKGAVITHAGLLANMRTLAANCGRDARDVVCSWLPHAHIAGLYTRLLALVVGGRAVVLPAVAFAARPAVWLETMSRYRCTITAAPDFAYALTAQVVPDDAVAALDLSAWAMAVSGGEMVRARTVERFFGKFARAGLSPDANHPYYGLTETLCTSIPQKTGPARLVASRAGLALGRVRAPEGDTDAITLLGNGAPLACEVLAVDPVTLRPVAPGRVGELWTRGPGVTRAYFGDAARTAEACEARLESGEGPYFRTGDLGVLHEGQVFVTGRLKELVIVRGKNHYPQDVEASAAKAGAELGLVDAAAFAVVQEDGEEALALAIEAKDPARATELLRAVRRAVATNHGLAIYKAFVLPPGGLPRTPTRKVPRATCRALAESGAWSDYAVAVARRAVAPEGPAVDAALSGLAGPALRAALLTRLLDILAAGDTGRLVGEQVDRPVAELGLSSLELARVGAELRALTGVEPPFAAFFDGTSARGVAERLADTMEGRRPTERPAEGWRTTLHAMAGGLPDRLPPLRARGGAILLTGATGFLGSYLLRELLSEGSRDIVCVVRATDAEHAMERLVAALAKGPGWNEAWRSRLSAVAGDVTAPRFGLDAEAFAALADRTALVVHNAADVNFVAPYAALRATNVDPAHQIAELAIAGGEMRPVHFVSTLAVFNATNRREQRRILSTDRLAEPDYIYSGYARSKWVAEALFRLLSSRGVPLGVHRPGLVIGASDTGHAHVDDFLCRFVKGCVELGRYPDADVEIDLVAVDHLARGLAAAVLQPLPNHQVTFQWAAPKVTRLGELMAIYRARGHRLDPEPTPAFLARLRNALPPENALFAVHPFLLEKPPGTDDTILELLDGLPLIVETTEADAARAAAGLRHEETTPAVLHAMAAWLEARGFLPSTN